MRKRDETIRAGDLVMIVRPNLCCGNADGVWEIYTVEDVGRYLLRCDSCKSISLEIAAVYHGSNYGTQLSRLKKIHPPAIDDSVERTEELTV